ncbi:hypothetical protein BGX26_005974, partial [Mortierella sp. AD094]
AIVAKKTGVIIQDAGFREARSGLRRYPNNANNANNAKSDVESLEVIDNSDDSASMEVIDDSDENESEVDAGDNAAVAAVAGSSTSKILYSESAQPSNKRKVPTFALDLKEPTFQFTDASPHSALHVAFRAYQDACRQLAIDSGGSLDFASHKAQSLALNGIWYVGKALSQCNDARAVMQTMSKGYRVLEFQDVTDLGVSMADILTQGNEKEITEAIDKIAAGDLSWRARRALKIWRQLADTLPDDYSPGRQNGEQAFVNTAIQPFLSVTFSSRGTKTLSGNIEHLSANEDKSDHARGVRSDFFIVYPIHQLSQHGSTCVGLVGEVKPPEKANSASLELKDQWKLFRMMKSEIDYQIKKGIKDPVVWGCQIFGVYF